MTESPNSTTDLVEPGGQLRLYVEADLAVGAELTLNESQAHYLRHVMRARAGDTLLVFNGRDGEWRVRLDLPGKRGAVVTAEGMTRHQVAAPDIWLCFAPIKKTAADYVAQKATELGAQALRPVMTRRTIVSRVNVERMQANAVEAAEQSDRLDVPACHEPQTLMKVLGAWPAERHLIFCDEAGAPPMLEALKAVPKGPWGVLIGPEGGFDPEERAAIRALAATVPVSLGSRILRADTAALATLAMLQASLGPAAA